MPKYLLEVAYAPQSWAAQIKDPKNRMEVVKPVFEKLGGRFESAYYAFGDRDLIIIAEFPDNPSAAAVSLAFAAGGALRSLRTTPLLSIEEGMTALRKAGQAAELYKPQR